MRVKEVINESKNIVVLTGAGVSVDSGIPDFQSIDSSWNHEISRHEAISVPFFHRNPERFWKLYRQLFESKRKATPNPFHAYLASLEKSHHVTVVTQNVDGLHTVAGSSNVLEMHGSVDRVVCARTSCSARFPAAQFAYTSLPKCPNCFKVLKPDVCLFGEQISHFETAGEAIIQSDLLIVAGTSLDVAPVNLLPLVAEKCDNGIKRLWINKDEPPYGYSFTDKYIGTLESFLKSVE